MLYFPFKLKFCKISRKIARTETEIDRIFLNVKGRPVHDQTAVLNAEMATSVEISQIFRIRAWTQSELNVFSENWHLHSLI